MRFDDDEPFCRVVFDPLASPMSATLAISGGGPKLLGDVALCGHPFSAAFFEEADGHGAGPGGPKLDAVFGAAGLRTGFPMIRPSRLFPLAWPIDRSARLCLERRTRHVTTMATISSTAMPPIAPAII